MQSNENLIEIKSEIHKEYLRLKNIQPVNIIDEVNIYHVSDLYRILLKVKGLGSDYVRKTYLFEEVELFEKIQNKYEK